MDEKDKKQFEWIIVKALNEELKKLPEGKTRKAFVQAIRNLALEEEIKMQPRELTEKEWRARDDAFALANAEEIKADPSRFQAAQDAAVKWLKKREKRLMR